MQSILRRAMGAIVIACGLPACTLYRASQDIGGIRELANVVGAIETNRADRPLFNGLFRDEGGHKTLSAYFVRYGSGPFKFIVAPGSYQVFAFEDANGNLGFDDGEPSYYVGDKQAPVKLEAGSIYDAGTLRMEVRRIDVAELRAAARRDLTTNVELTSVQRGTVISLDDPRFTSDTGREGMWTPLQSVIAHGTGIYFLEPYDAARIPVVFVHGVSGTAGDFRAFVDALDKRRYQPWFFQWPTGARLENAAAFLQALLAEMQARHRFERYAVVAHSAGGLVARAALLKIQKEGGKMPCAFVTISTPYGGVESAETGTRRSPVVLPAWIDLAPGSPFIRTLFDTPLRNNVSTYLYFGYVGGNGTDGAVALDSMLRPEAQQQAGLVRGFPESHRAILRSRESVAAVNNSLACRIAP
jgi:pimeloyl-ACP methyl ester carboxylesterase